MFIKGFIRKFGQSEHTEQILGPLHNSGNTTFALNKRMKAMKRFLTLLFCLQGLTHAFAQLTLEQCRQDAQANYPLVRQYRLIEMSEEYSLSNAAKGNLPQISLGGKATYQSDATTLPFEVPDIDFHGVSKDQYQVTVEISQNIWDGGEIKNRKKQTEAATDEALKQTDVSMYALNERVNQVFFGILLIDEQLKQNRLLSDDLERNLRNVTAYRDNGIANDADIDAVKVEILQTDQQRIKLNNSRKAYLQMLAMLTGKELENDTQLAVPETPELNAGELINRPELALYAAQGHTIDVERQRLRTGFMPKFSLFAQGGYGNPGLNMLEDKFSPYYIVGARMNWNFGSLYTLKDDKRKLETRRKQIANDRELFLFNTRLKLTEEKGNIATLQRQMESDEEIVKLRTNIRKASEAKVANGTMSVTDMLRELTRESLAKQDLAVRKIELLKAQYELKHLTN